MSIYDDVMAEYNELEQQADELLQAEDPNSEDRRFALTRTLREALRRNRGAYNKIREEVRAELVAEMATERKAEAAWRTAGVPEAARVLFDGIQPTDSQAVQARIAELRQAGLTWGDAVPPPPPRPDPMQAQVAAMQQAAAGGATPGLAGDLKTRMLDMERNPHKYTDEQHTEIVAEYNRAVNAAARSGYGANSS